MEMEFRDDTRRRKVLVILGLMFAVAAAGAAFLLISQAQSGGTKVVTREVVVAAHDISERSIIQSGDVTLRALPDDPSLTSALTKPEDAVGRIAGVTIFAQQPITPNLLTSSEAGSGFSILAPEETIAPDSPFWRAVSVDVPDDRAVGGVILIGQRVDLFVTVDIEIQKLDGNAAPTPVPTPNPSGPFGPFGPYYTNPSTKITYQDLPVLVHSGTLYVVKATVAQAEEISHFEAAGSASFSLALRPEGDKRPVPTASMGVTTNIIVWRYGYPIPRILLLP